MSSEEILRQPTGEVIRILRTGTQTDGAAFEFEATLPPRTTGPPAHRHEVAQESFEVLDGRVSIRVGDHWQEVEPGETVIVPPGTVHAFANRTDREARMLTRERPADQLEEQLRLLSRSGRVPPLLALAALNVRHDLSVSAQRPLWRGLAFVASLGRRARRRP